MHLPRIVKETGPLSETWAFPFESFNNVIARCVHGSKNFNAEIANRLVMAQKLAPLKTLLKISEESEEAKIITHPKDVFKHNFNDNEKLILTSNNLDPSAVTVYKKLSFNHPLALHAKF